MPGVHETSVLKSLTSEQIDSFKDHICWQALIEFMDIKVSTLEDEILLIAKDIDLTFQERGEHISNLVYEINSINILKELPDTLRVEIRREELKTQDHLRSERNE